MAIVKSIFMIIKSPQSGVTLCFQFVSAAASAAAAAANTFASHVKTVWASHWNLGHREYGSEKMYWMTFWWPWPKVTAVTLINTNLLVCRIKWELLTQYQLGSNISRIMLITWLDFGGFLLETLFLPNFRWNFWMCFFKVKLSIGQISGMVGPIDVKRKGGASVEYWVDYVTLTFNLTHDLDLVVSRSKFEIALFEKWRVDWHGTKGMWVDHSWPWPWAMGCESIIHFMTMTVSYG